MLFYERVGTGPTVVFIHGFLGSSKIYDEIKQDLISTYDTIFIDFAGHGRSQEQTVDANIYAYAQQIVEVLQHENVTSSTWIGHSMGGYIVLAALEKQLAQIDKAVLAYSATNADNDEAKKKRLTSIEQIESEGNKAFVDSLIPNFFSKEAKQEHVELGRHIAYAASEDGLKTALLTMKDRPNQQQLVDTLDIPVLVIEGTEDKIVPSIETTNPNVKKVQTPTGHLGMIEEPAKFIDALRTFI